MEDQLNKLIGKRICDIIFDKNTSINKKIDIIYKRLSKYNGDYIKPFKAPLQINKQEIEQMIITVITKKEGEAMPKYYDIFVSNISEKIIDDEVRKLFKK